MENKFFFMNPNWKGCIQELTNEELGKLIKAIFAYVNRDEKPDFPRGSGLSIAFNFMISEIEVMNDNEE